MDTTTTNNKNTLFETLKRLATLYIENVKLSSAEKLTILFSGIALFAIVLFLALIALVFVAIGLATMLESYIAPFWSYFIIAGVLFVCIAILIIGKTQFIVNPIARFISKLLLNPPKKQ